MNTKHGTQCQAHARYSLDAELATFRMFNPQKKKHKQKTCSIQCPRPYEKSHVFAQPQNSTSSDNLQGLQRRDSPTCSTIGVVRWFGGFDFCGKNVPFDSHRTPPVIHPDRDLGTETNIQTVHSHDGLLCFGRFYKAHCQFADLSRSHQQPRLRSLKRFKTNCSRRVKCDAPHLTPGVQIVQLHRSTWRLTRWGEKKYVSSLCDVEGD